jgi:hypothetical protein
MKEEAKVFYCSGGCCWDKPLQNGPFRAKWNGYAQLQSYWEQGQGQLDETSMLGYFLGLETTLNMIYDVCA